MSPRAWSIDRIASTLGTAVRRRGVPRWLDGLIALVIFLGTAIAVTAYWKRTAAVNQPFYYQQYFEPAVMIGCGKGFVVARPQIAAMVPFLWRQVDRFSCEAILPDAPLGTDDLFQLGSWRYLMLTVGYTWRLVGVSWSALGPLFGTLFGLTIAAAYTIFRLGMSPLLSVLAAVALRYSVLQLKYLPILRDYAKAPFALTLLFLLGLLVVRRATWRGVLATAAAYGVVVGVGYGFRTDFVAYLPPFFLTLVLFLEGGVLRHIRLKVAAGLLCVLAYLATAWPVITTLEKARSGCGWHVVLQGFADPFDARLGVDDVPYELSREYLDEWTYTTVTSYAARVQPGIGHFGWCETPYSLATRAYLTEIAKHFPADVIVRTYASILRIVELPFSPVPGIDDDGDKRPDWGAGHGAGLLMVVAAIALITAANMRVGLFLLFFLLYFGGLPAIQFDHRHFFHLEFITWWAGGFLLQSAITDFRLRLSERASLRAALSGLRAAAIVLIGCSTALVAMLWAARAYQQPTVRAMLSDYLAAPRERVAIEQVSSSAASLRVSPHTDPETADFVAIDVDGSRCGEHPTLAFRYDETTRLAYGRSFEVARQPGGAGLTHIFMPIYDGFRRVEFSDAPPGCIDGMYRVRDPHRFSMLLEVMLPPGWRRQPLYQRLTAWGF